MTERSELSLTLHGLEKFNQDVDGEVFARKFSAFMRGLIAADKAANGGKRNKFLLTDLRKNTATAQVREQTYVYGPAAKSALEYYMFALDAVYNDLPSARQFPKAVVNQISKLNSGVGRTFDFGVVKSTEGKVIRIDEFLERRARRVLSDIDAGPRIVAGVFAGVVYASFDGTLKAVDLRGDGQKAVLQLTAGGREIECIVNAIAVPDLGNALDKRVVVYGTAHYERGHGLPVRIDVRAVQPVAQGAGLSRWQGAFESATTQTASTGWQ